MLDTELVLGVMKGKVDYAVLMENFRQQVHRWLYAVVGPGADLEELTERVFIRAHSRLGQYEPAKGSFGAWLHTITHNVAVSFLRERNRAPESLDAMTEDEAPTCAGPSEQHEAAEARARLYRRIDELDPRERHAFIGRHVRRLSWRKLAAEMGCCLRSAHYWVARAIAKLRKEL